MSKEIKLADKAKEVLIALMIVVIAVLASFLFTSTASAYVGGRYANEIYEIPYQGGGSPKVYVFDDQDNKCYVVVGDGGSSKENPAISCVKR